jgi:Mrp family chromosome partitioning ATPase
LLSQAKQLRRFVQFVEMKSLLDRVLQLQEQAKFHTLALLSEFDGEGKTFITAALARAYTERLHRKVLIVDASTPQPAHAPVPAKNRRGADLLGSLLDDAEDIDIIGLREWSGSQPGAKVDEYKIQALFAQMASRYSLVFVDTSSLSRRNLNNFDPALIARQCDAALLISSRSEIVQNISEEHRRRIQGQNIRLIGMIHNQGEAGHAPPRAKSEKHGKL